MRSAASENVCARPVFFAMGNDATARPENARSKVSANIQTTPKRTVNFTEAQSAKYNMSIIG